MSNERPPETPVTLPETCIVDLAMLNKPLDWEAIFGRPGRVEIEVGIGSGYFLSRYAQDNPDINLFGMDKEGSEVYRTNDKCRRLGIPNVRLLRCDALYFLTDYPGDASVDAYHIYYSDPWPKTRHHKRRLWRPEIVPMLERTLKSGGDLFMKTDVTEYFEVICQVLGAATQLELVEERRIDIDPIENDYETNFQRKAREKGHPLHYQHWRRK